MEYIEHLKKDAKLATIISGPIGYSLTTQKNIAFKLICSIMSQQLHTKVAAILQQRFIKLCGTSNPSSQKILSLDTEALRSIGLSAAKASYVHNVAMFCQEHRITDKKLNDMDNEEIISLLTQIKGVGRWTVEMLLMFSMGRTDVFALNDLGLQHAVIKLYHITIEDKKKRLIKIKSLSEKWAPYRTYAALYLWQWKDNG
jgi:DNA-3-methyladenine glycosylase II